MKILQWSGALLFNLTLLSLPQESGAFAKICILHICVQSNSSGSILQKFINFVEQRLKFSHF